MEEGPGIYSSWNHTSKIILQIVPLQIVVKEPTYERRRIWSSQADGSCLCEVVGLMIAAGRIIVTGECPILVGACQLEDDSYNWCNFHVIVWGAEYDPYWISGCPTLWQTSRKEL